MKKIQSFWAVVLCVILFCGCKQSPKLNSNLTVITFDNYQPRIIEVDSCFSDIKATVLESNDNNVLSYVKQAELVDSLLFICDNSILCVFNLNGEFISTIGRQGHGPGEYSALKGFFINMDDATISVIDDGTDKIISYDFDGTHISSKEIDGGLFSWGYCAMLTADDKVLIFNEHNPTHNMAYTVADMKYPEHVEYFNSYDPVKLERYTCHFAKHPMTRSGNNIHLTMPLDNVVYEYFEGNIHPKYRIETPKKVIPRDFIDLSAGPENSYFSQLVDLTMDGYFGGFTDIFETDDSIYLHYMAKGAYPGLYIVDKNNNKGEYFLYPSATERLVLPVFPFSASYGNTLVSILPVHQSMSLKAHVEDGQEVSDELREALDRMDESGQQLIMIYKL